MPRSHQASSAAVAVPLEALAPAGPGRPSAGSRILFTVVALVVYRLGTSIPIPGIDTALLEELLKPRLLFVFLPMFNMFADGAVGRMAIFALNLMPYISALIIVQLVAAVVPGLTALKKQDERGRRLTGQYARCLTVALAAVQACAVVYWLEGFNRLPDVVVIAPGALFRISAVVTMTGGAVFLMWLGERITARGVGNGAALIIMSDIAAGLPGSLADLLILYGAISSPQFIALVGLMLSVAAGVVFVEGARRRLLVQYTGRQAGDGLFRGDTPYLALKFNGSGVIAPIYASSLLKLLITFAGFSAAESGCRPDWLCIIVSLLGREQPLYFLLDVALIMFFTFFCTPIVVNPQQMADDLRRHGGFVPGIRPGAETAAYIDHVQTRITVIGAMYLAAAWVLPALLFPGMRFDFSGSALLIVVIGTLELLACTRTLLRLPPST